MSLSDLDFDTAESFSAADPLADFTFEDDSSLDLRAPHRPVGNSPMIASGGSIVAAEDALHLAAVDEAEDAVDEQLFYFDLETIPDESRLDSFGLEPIGELKETPVETLYSAEEFVSQDLKAAKGYCEGKMPPLEWIDSVRLAESQQKKPRAGIEELMKSLEAARDAVTAAVPEREKLLSVTPEFCRIAAIGFSTGSGNLESVLFNTIDQERQFLAQFWQMTSGRRFVGFNILSFDLPVLLARSVILGVNPGRLISLSPYTNRDALDLMRVRFGNMTPKGMGLKKLARIYGIEVPAGDVEGDQVLHMYRAQQWERINAYVQSDVFITRALHRKWRGKFCD